MATMAPSPARQPLGVMGGSRVRGLQSMKNRQNGILSNNTPLPSLKRARIQDNSDDENVDPIVINSDSKRKRLDSEQNYVKPAKYTLTTIPTPKPRLQTPATVSRPALNTNIKPATPASALAAAGRSPTHNAAGRRLRLSSRAPFRRSDGLSSSSSSKLTLSSALRGTLAHKKTQSLSSSKHASTDLSDAKPKSWLFEIYEETEAQQEYNMNEWSMTQSANILEISDDESNAVEKVECEENKENVCPLNDPAAPAVASSRRGVSRKDAMTDEPRTPLGDLEAKDYYGEGLDATSVVLVQEAIEDGNTSVSTARPSMDAVIAADEKSETSFTFQLPESEEKLSHAEISALLVSTTDIEAPDLVVDENDSTGIVENLMSATEGDIEIWESESAKAEEEEANTVAEHESIFVF